jgi:type VI secretion system protein ImpH
MAADDGKPAGLLDERLAPLLKQAHRSSFFQLVSLLERLTGDAVRVGGDGPPSREALRFRHDPSMGFPTGDVRKAAIRWVPRDLDQPQGPKRPVVELLTTFLGLTGSVSPLPLYIAEEVIHEDAENPVKRDFLDVFHHRLISILFRAVSRYSPAREHRSRGDDPWLGRMLSIAGMDPDAYVPASGISASKLLRLAPAVARRGRGARTLERALRVVLEDHLGDEGRVEVVELAGGWMPVHAEQRCALGRANNDLGRGAMLGVRTFDRSGSFKVVVGPLGAIGRTDFAETGRGLKALRACVALVVPAPLDYDVELRIAAGATAPFRLSTSEPGRLGANTRLGSVGEGETIQLRNVGRARATTMQPAQEA